MIEITTYSDFAGVEEKLRKKGFINNITSGIICRYKIKSIIVDVMPTKEEQRGVLGVSNLWYKDGFRLRMEYYIEKDISIQIFTTPCLLASKIEAFKNRGGNDGR